MNYGKWIADGIKKDGKSAVGLAKAITKALRLSAPMHRGTIYKMIKGQRKIYSEELPPIAEYIEEPVPNMSIQSSLQNLQTLPIEREIAAGVWREADASILPDLGTVTVPTDLEYPAAKHIAYRMRDDSMVASGILDGDAVICIKSDDPPSDGRQVIVERKRAGLVETSARITSVLKDRIEYICNEHKPIVVASGNKRKSATEPESVKVVAIIRRVMRILK